MPDGIRIAAVGPATADAVRARGARVDAMPENFRGTAVAGAIGDATGARILLPRSDIATPDTAESLRALGAVVDDVVAYRTVPADASRQRGDTAAASRDAIVELISQVDAITFASPSSARGLARMAGTTLAAVSRHATIACIGPVTSAAVRELGLPVHVEPEEHTTPALVDALENYWAQTPAGQAPRPERRNPLGRGA